MSHDFIYILKKTQLFKYRPFLPLLLFAFPAETVTQNVIKKIFLSALSSIVTSVCQSIVLFRCSFYSVVFFLIFLVQLRLIKLSLSLALSLSVSS